MQACYVGDSCCAAVGNGDLVLLSAGPSYYATVNTVAVQARQAGLHSHQCFNSLILSMPAHSLLANRISVYLNSQLQRTLGKAGLQLQCSPVPQTLVPALGTTVLLQSPFDLEVLLAHRQAAHTILLPSAVQRAGSLL